MLLMSTKDNIELKGSPDEIRNDELSTKVITDNEIPVCIYLFPVPFGTYKSDSMSVGLKIPAPYILLNSEIQSAFDSINITSNGQVLSKIML